MKRHKPSHGRSGAKPAPKSALAAVTPALRNARTLLDAGDAATAAALVKAHLQTDATDAGAWIVLGTALKGTQDLEGATAAYRAALAHRPASAEAHAGLADVFLMRGAPGAALDLCEKAIALGRATPKASHFAIAGRALSELGRFDEGFVALAKAMKLEPNNPDAYFVLGLMLSDQGKPLEAFGAYQRAIELHPRHVLAYNNIAGLLVTLGQLDLAIAAARVAAGLAPDHPDLYVNLAIALRLKGEDDEALATYEKIVALKPDHGEALVELCHRRQHNCDWSGLQTQMEVSWTHSYRQGRTVSPFVIMTATGSPIEQLLCARVFGRGLTQVVKAPLAPYAPRSAVKRHGKLKIGYLSADFHHHATAMLIADMLEQHDKTRFEIHGYSLGPDDGSPMRKRLVAAFDGFTDMRAMNDPQAAARIKADDIDVLLDLKGYTRDARVKILSYEPAPVQVNYLGFPGTMGAPFIDYIIADPHVAPMAHQEFYDERIVQLPHCYQPNDRQRAIPDDTAPRADHGLPEAGFVFCCFNSPYKITPAIFDIWMRLLAGKPGSVLWILAPKPRAIDNLRREATARGMDPHRLVFAPFVSADRHLARLRLADLFLDTIPVNAHTTASEALWAGLPLLTCAGESFASRVAASLLHGIGMPMLVTPSLGDYETMAMTLAHDPVMLAGIRNRMQTNRLAAPLFDTPRYTRDFETALVHMTALRDAGRPPEAFSVASIKG